MARILIHIVTGPADANRTTLAFFVARQALTDGHAVDLFLAGDGVELLTAESLQTVAGLGTGHLGEHFQHIVQDGGRFYVSRLSAQARNLGDELVTGRPAQFVYPSKLVSLLVEADKSLVY